MEPYIEEFLRKYPGEEFKQTSGPYSARDYEYTCAHPATQPEKKPDTIDPVTGKVTQYFVLSPLCRDINDGTCPYYEEKS